MARRVIEVEFDTPWDAQEFKEYLRGEIDGSKKLRNEDKKGWPSEDGQEGTTVHWNGKDDVKVHVNGSAAPKEKGWRFRKPSTVGLTRIKEYRNANGALELYVKSPSQLESEFNVEFERKLRSYGYDGMIPWIPTTTSKYSAMKMGERSLKACEKYLSANNIDSTFETAFGKSPKLVVHVDDLKQDEIDLLYTGLKDYTVGNCQVGSKIPVKTSFCFIPTGSGVVDAWTSILGIEQRVKYDGDVYRKGYSIEAELRGRRSAVKKLAEQDAREKAEGLGGPTTKYSVRKK